MGRCHILIEDPEPQFEYENQDLTGCFLVFGHAGYHLNKLEDGRYISWGGYACDKNCEHCGECFNWQEISEAEALDIISGRVENRHD